MKSVVCFNCAYEWIFKDIILRKETLFEDPFLEYNLN